MVSGRVAGAVAAAVLAAAAASGQAVAVPTGPGTRPEPPRPAAEREAVGASARGSLPSSYLRPAAPPAGPALRPLPRPAADTTVRPAVQGVRGRTAPADTGPFTTVAPLAPAGTGPTDPAAVLTDRPAEPAGALAPGSLVPGAGLTGTGDLATGALGTPTGVLPGTGGTSTTPYGYPTTAEEQAPAAGGQGQRPAGEYRLLVGSHFSAVPKALAPAADLPKALTYKPSLVPAGAGVEVEQRTEGEGTRVTLRVTGLKAGHRYGAHVHTGVCGTDPAAAGGHYQHEKDPAQPSTDPDYANPRNEVWLDVTADTLGNGTATAAHPWDFRPGEARSVVLHEAAGATERVACVSVPFRGW
ncbi:superoxide dismutase [Streptomyces sp. P6-2-1]|uniref:superoxide dismutase n=1 Tax=Streptomyces sp. P6-2-1 TaxID=3422591 RepID=UPI003D36CD5F